VTQQRAVVDSSGWIELFTNGPLADRFLALLEAEENLVVPAISILEVFKWVLREHSEAQAIQAAAVMQRGLVVDLDSRLPMADSIIVATARVHQARLYTLDADFKDLHDVELLQGK
jgi:predicted nucleic acid-binding protein